MPAPIESPEKPASGTRTITLRRIGNSVGFTIPKDVLARLGASEGETLHVVETQDGILLTPYDPHFSKVVAAYEEIEERYKNAFHELAK